MEGGYLHADGNSGDQFVGELWRLGVKRNGSWVCYFCCVALVGSISGLDLDSFAVYHISLGGLEGRMADLDVRLGPKVAHLEPKEPRHSLHGEFRFGRSNNSCHWPCGTFSREFDGNGPV